MKRMLFNATQQEESRVAIVDGQKLINLDIETLGREQRKGNIYKGKITKVEPSLEACFVDYGTPRQGFLPFKEIHRSYLSDHSRGRGKIQDALKEGIEVLVQIEKDERGNKGAALTTYISLAGRYLVLMPNNPRGGGVSRRVEGQERLELKNITNQLQIPAGMSVIARTAGIGRSLEELQWDLDYQLKLWDAVAAAYRQENIQPLILQESALVIRAIRDYFQPDIGEILVDNREVFDKIYQFISFVMPQNLSKVKFYQDPVPLFSRFQIESQIDSVYARQVSLPSGGEIVIDHTEALVSVDVNSAKSTKGADVEETALRTNLEAAEEISRQLSLRDIGGLVVVDFIDMEDLRHQREVENTLREFLRADRARVQTTKLSRFGLMEISRQRLQVALGETTHMICPRCYGTGAIRSVQSSAIHVLRVIEEKARKENTGEIRAQLPVDVATFLLNEKREQLFNLEERLAVPIIIIPNKHLATPHYTVDRIRLDEVGEEQLSYDLVEEPSPQEYESNSQKLRDSEQMQAAVQGVHPTAPAPLVSAQKSLWRGLSTWLGHFFATDIVSAKPERPAPAYSGRDNFAANPRRSYKKFDRREDKKAVNLSPDSGAVKKSPPRSDKSVTKSITAAAAEPKSGTERKEPVIKSANRQNTAAATAVSRPVRKNPPAATISANREETAAPPLEKKGQAPAREKNSKNNKNRIPRADYIEGRIDVDKISRHVGRIATAVLKEENFTAAVKPLPTAAAVSVPEINQVIPPQEVTIKTGRAAAVAPEIFQDKAAAVIADSPDLKRVKLMMVETKAGSSAPAVKTAATAKVKRRQDLAPAAVAARAAIAQDLRQVETKK